jgi:cytoskeletal protein CcmA (bactofilin family)
VANVRKQPPDKIGADCPHCGFSQLEPASARSAFCRQCSQHYSIQKLLAKEVASLKQPSLLDRFGKWINREKSRSITCFSCREKHEVPTSAESSLCPRCGSYIDIRDFRIEGPFARSIQTQGLVHLSSTADVACPRILCGSARIEGRFRGKIICTEESTIRMGGHYEGEIDSEKILIHSKADVDFQHPVYSRALDIDGKTRGTFICEGRVTIRKKGVLEGTIYARSIAVDKGGIFSGSLIIGQTLPAEFQRPDPRTWFPGGGSAPAPVAAEDFGDFPPSPETAGVDDEGEILEQPQLELQIKRRRRN